MLNPKPDYPVSEHPLYYPSDFRRSDLSGVSSIQAGLGSAGWSGFEIETAESRRSRSARFAVRGSEDWTEDNLIKK